LETPIVKPDWIYKVWADRDVVGIKANDKMVNKKYGIECLRKV
jgi:hypothetical protein